MGLLDDIHAEQMAGRRGPQCAVARAHATLTKSERADLDAALADTANITHAAISRALKKHGVHAPADGISRHRRGECTCDHG